MKHKYWLLLSLAPVAAAQLAACAEKFDTCENRRTCPPGGAAGAKAGSGGGSSAGEAGEQPTDG
ncbi:MAG TPA: hypothetical protein VER11_25130, partial [Polyangiaceae bacterium]|nr:hypothetical protein [Polyangiaceae bacterium]